MYGTMMRAQVKPANRDAVVSMMGEGLDTDGFHATHVLVPDEDPGVFVAAIVFENRETYQANAHDPATVEWYGRFRALLEDDPEWTDGGWISFLPTRLTN